MDFSTAINLLDYKSIFLPLHHFQREALACKLIVDASSIKTSTMLLSPLILDSCIIEMNSANPWCRIESHTSDPCERIVALIWIVLPVSEVECFHNLSNGLLIRIRSCWPFMQIRYGEYSYCSLLFTYCLCAELDYKALAIWQTLTLWERAGECEAAALSNENDAQMRINREKSKALSIIRFALPRLML